MKNIFLYVVSVAIWGSTWIAIKFQLGFVDPLISVFYRYVLAAMILIIFCYARGLKMKFSFKEHRYFALLGLFLFSVSYWLVYIAEVYVTSALLAVTYSSLVFMNIFNGALFLKTPIKAQMITGAFVGIIGICLIFMPEIKSFDFSDKAFFGLILSFTSVYIASLGNILSSRNQKAGMPVIQTNAYAMMYGAIILLIIALFLKKDFTFLFTTSYLISLVYLSVFGSVLAFGSYLTLIGEIGADRASYAIMLVPVVALGISSLFEGYVWNIQSVLGLLLVLIGNFMALRKKADFS